MSKPMSDDVFYQHWNAYNKPEPTDDDLRALSIKTRSHNPFDELMASVYGTLAPGALSIGHKVPEIPDEFLPLMGDYPYLPAINERTGQPFVDSNTGAYANSNNALDPEFTSQYNPTGHPEDDPDAIHYENAVEEAMQIPTIKNIIEQLQRNGRGAYTENQLITLARSMLNRI